MTTTPPTAPLNPLLGTIARAYVINLPTRPDRLAAVGADLARAGMPIDGSRVRVFPGIRPAQAAPFRSLGEHGCFRSHLGALRAARDEGSPNVLVMEDDWKHEPALAAHGQAVADALAALPSWDLVYLGHGEQTDQALTPGQPVAFQPWPAQRRVMLAHSYLVNGRTLGRLVAALETFLGRADGDPAGGPMPFDGALSTFRQQNPDVRTYLAVPNLVGQRASASDITPRLWDRYAALRPVGRLLRRLRDGRG